MSKCGTECPTYGYSLLAVVLISFYDIDEENGKENNKLTSLMNNMPFKRKQLLQL